jgi:ABC-2 type transport system ATP-binding protein
MATVIFVRNLSKIYSGGFRALKGINLEIRRGEFFALLGPNGAGKPTLIIFFQAWALWSFMLN